MTAMQLRYLRTARVHLIAADFANPTFLALRDLGFVTGKPLYQANGRLSKNYCWSITDAGIAALEGVNHDR